VDRFLPIRETTNAEIDPISGATSEFEIPERTALNLVQAKSKDQDTMSGMPTSRLYLLLTE
jgi:hypothetical protein